MFRDGFVATKLQYFSGKSYRKNCSLLGLLPFWFFFHYFIRAQVESIPCARAPTTNRATMRAVYVLERILPALLLWWIYLLLVLPWLLPNETKHCEVVFTLHVVVFILSFISCKLNMISMVESLLLFFICLCHERLNFVKPFLPWAVLFICLLVVSNASQ